MPLLALVAFALTTFPSIPSSPPADERVDGWRSDVDFFVAEARRVHADPERPAFSLRFEAAADELRAAIPELTDDQILGRMMRLAAILDDGHTVVYGPAPSSPLAFEGRVLPFKFYLFPSGLHIVDGEDEHVDLAGSRVVRIGGVPADEVLRRMAEFRGVDNAQTWTWMGPQFYLPRLLLLREVGVAVNDGVVEIELVTLDGDEQTVSAPCTERELARKLRPFPLRVGDPPRYLSNVDTNYWMEPLDEHGALYVQFNQVRDAPLESIAAFSARLRATLAEQQPTTLIVDVRHNNGGNNTLVRPFVRALIEFDMRSADHRLFVLMGRNTFSAAQNFINRIERWTDATFVGEPSSSCPNFVGEGNELLLPFSRLSVSISNLLWQDSDPWDDRPWIEPDLAVLLTADDYFAGVDPVLERVLEE